MTLSLRNFTKQHDRADESLSQVAKLTKAYNEAILDEISLTDVQIAVKSVGKVDSKKRIEAETESLLAHNILESLATMLGTVTF